MKPGAGGGGTAPPPQAAARRAPPAAIVDALGGPGNVVQLERIALTRLRVQVRDARAIDERALEAAGASGLLRISDSVVHVVVGDGADGGR